MVPNFLKRRSGRYSRLNAPVAITQDKKMAGLDLSTLAGIAAVVQTGDIIRRDNPDQSRLLKVTGYEEKLRMPPTGKLPTAVIADLKTWVIAGAPLPALPVMAATPAAPPKK